MSCKFKKFDEPRFCQVIDGECQFLLNGYDDHCPISAAYYDFDKFWVETEAAKNGGVVTIENIKSENSSETINLNIGK